MDQQLDWTGTARRCIPFARARSPWTPFRTYVSARVSPTGPSSSTAQVRIDQEGHNISDYLAGPAEVVYVPYYDPAVIYGTLVVAGLSTGVLATVARLLRGSRAGHRVCVGPQLSRWEPVSSSAPSTGRIDRSMW